MTSRSKNEAANWGYEKMIEHDARYEQAQEHLHVVRALWDSIEPDAVVLDRETGLFCDPEKVHLLNFHGRYYNVRGPLPALPSPQGRPVIIQAGQSGPGMDLAAHYADLQFSTRRTLPSMKAHRADLDAKLANSAASRAIARSFGRCGYRWRSWEAKAREMEQHYLDTIPPEAGLIELSSMYGLDFSQFRRDMRLSDVAAEVKAQNVHWGSFEEIIKTTDPNLTVEQFGRKFMTERILVAAVRPRRSSTSWRNGISKPVPMADSCSCVAFPPREISRSLSTLSSRNCSAAACQRRGIPARRCATISCTRLVQPSPLNHA